MIIADYKIRKMLEIIMRNPSQVCRALGPCLVAGWGSSVAVTGERRDGGWSRVSARWHWACSSGSGTRFSPVSVPVLAGLWVPWGQRQSWAVSVSPPLLQQRCPKPPVSHVCQLPPSPWPCSVAPVSPLVLVLPGRTGCGVPIPGAHVPPRRPPLMRVSDRSIVASFVPPSVLGVCTKPAMETKGSRCPRKPTGAIRKCKYECKFLRRLPGPGKLSLGRWCPQLRGWGQC